ncbi:hypothetical protein K9M50_00395 [Patescibacteria group bacterium]|nr:hypothetical protein [Patescibacteria group bacterium]
MSINQSSEVIAQTDYPRLVNYYLEWSISDSEAVDLAKWDMLILDMEVQENSPEAIRKIRNYNPDIKILAYITSQEIIDYSQQSFQTNASLRAKLYNQIHDSWWLKDYQGNKISFWQGTKMLNMSSGSGISSNNEKWNEFLPRFVDKEILSTGLWDGVFYDNIWGDISWLNSANIDIDNNKQRTSNKYMDSAWNKGTEKMLRISRDLNPEAIIMGNGRVFFEYQNYLNGMMLEDFPSSWENGGNWSGSMKTYMNLKKYNTNPQTSVILAFKDQNKPYQKMRYSLTSTLMENGYFGYNQSVYKQGELWFYDEYKFSLGQAQSQANNLLSSSSQMQSGLWRRNFEKGIAVLNSSSEKKSYFFDKEEFEKLKGEQAPDINNGTIVNYVNLEPKDGVILKKRQTEIKNAVFDNGAYVRVFNKDGKQVSNGFFAYKDAYPGKSQIIVSDIDNDSINETLVNYDGVINIYKNGRVYKEFEPYDNKFQGEISVAIADLDGDGTKEIITGAGPGGGPHVRVFSKDGVPLIGGFFAYETNFRGGVNVAVLDLNSDGTKEIITGAGPGGGPHVRVFSKDGVPLIGGFFAFDREFKGGISLSVGDVNGDGKGEIISTAGLGGSPRVKIFNRDGKLLDSFLAYEASYNEGIKVITLDINGDGIKEILTQTFNF